MILRRDSLGRVTAHGREDHRCREPTLGALRNWPLLHGEGQYCRERIHRLIVLRLPSRVTHSLQGFGAQPGGSGNLELVRSIHHARAMYNAHSLQRVLESSTVASQRTPLRRVRRSWETRAFPASCNAAQKRRSLYDAHPGAPWMSRAFSQADTTVGHILSLLRCASRVGSDDIKHEDP